MGALHDGHVALIRAARDLVGPDGAVTVTIFVNPLQFGAGEDLERYPRGLEADLDICRAEGVDLVFAPDRAEMYPNGRPQVTVDPGPLAGELEGAARPTHFAGVLTVVAKLLNLTIPTYALFGEKDYHSPSSSPDGARSRDALRDRRGAHGARAGRLPSRNRYLGVTSARPPGVLPLVRRRRGGPGNASRAEAGRTARRRARIDVDYRAA
jgi:pantoate--beta-alanine ligase